MTRTARPLRTSLAAALLMLGAACDSNDADLRDEAIEAAPAVRDAAADDDEAARAAAIAGGKAAAMDFKAAHDVAQAHMAEIDACYKAALKDSPELSGRVVMAFALEADGAVASVVAEEDTIGAAVSSCVREAAATWSFPAPNNGKTELRYPFVFAPESDRPAPDVQSVELEVKGGLDRDIIRRIVRAHINEIRHCYNLGLDRDPELAGRVVAEFTIGADGRVKAPATIAEGIGDAETETCVAEAVQRWIFPKTKDGEVSVTYPFVLSPG
ncbi:MAG: AgmX/PglI C-terminal domain-containing protein [Nannocystaceae bacterium]